MRKRTRLLLIILACVVVLGGAGVAWRLIASAAGRGVTITLVHPLVREADVVVLRQVLAEFTSLYSRIRVLDDARDPSLLRGSGLVGGAGEKADVMVATGPAPTGASVWAAPPLQWTGTLWVLAGRRDVLDRQADLADRVQALREGKLGTAGFVELLAALKTKGLAPLTVGNSHRWPFLVWLQHWAAATIGIDAVETLPTGRAAEDAAYLARLAPAFKDLAAWRQRGWFDAAAWSQGWAQGLQPLADGTACFALLSTPLLTALPPDARQTLEFYPFPGSRGGAGGSWTIGSVYLIGASSASAHPQEAALLARFLTSPGVTQKLSRGLGRPFFSWQADDANPARVIPDWYGAANTPEFRVLEEKLGAP